MVSTTAESMRGTLVRPCLARKAGDRLLLQTPERRVDLGEADPTWHEIRATPSDSADEKGSASTGPFRIAGRDGHGDPRHCTDSSSCSITRMEASATSRHKKPHHAQSSAAPHPGLGGLVGFALLARLNAAAICLTTSTERPRERWSPRARRRRSRAWGGARPRRRPRPLVRTSAGRIRRAVDQRPLEHGDPALSA